MQKLYLHVGFGKCGSSAIQAALTENHTVATAGGEARYAAVLPTCDILTGERLREYAACLPHRYAVSSPGIPNLAAAAPFRKKLLQAFGTAAFGGDSIWILSQEAWGKRPDKFVEAGWLEALGCEIEVVAYMRPQVEWLNSACWQWFYWKDGGGDASQSHRLAGPRAMDWNHWLEQWEKVPGVTKVTARILPRDAVADFFSIIQADPGTLVSNPANNVTLPLEIMSLLSRLGPVRKNNGSIVDFVLQQRLATKGSKPWAISAETAAEVIARHKDSNARLLARLDDASAEAMRNDPRWWDAGVYADVRVDDPAGVAIPPQLAEQWLRQAVRGLIEAEKELSVLRKERFMEALGKAKA